MFFACLLAYFLYLFNNCTCISFFNLLCVFFILVYVRHQEFPGVDSANYGIGFYSYPRLAIAHDSFFSLLLEKQKWYCKSLRPFELFFSMCVVHEDMWGWVSTVFFSILYFMLLSTIFFSQEFEHHSHFPPPSCHITV